MRIAVLAFVMAIAIGPAAAAAPGPHSMGGPVLYAVAPMGGSTATVEYRYAFYLYADAEAYLKNDPGPYNAAFGTNWTTRVLLHGPDGVSDLGPLQGDHAKGLGALGTNATYGIELRVTVPAEALAQPATLTLSYVLAVHETAQGQSSGASLDPSVQVRLDLQVAEGSQQAALGPWTLPPKPKPGDPDWPDAGARDLAETSTNGAWFIPQSTLGKLLAAGAGLAIVAAAMLTVVVARKSKSDGESRQ